MKTSKTLLAKCIVFCLIVILYILINTLTSLNAHAAQHVISSGANTYSKISQYTNLGEAVNWTVAPGSAGQAQQVYISYKYYNGSFDLVEADPYTGNFRIHPSPIPGEWGANAEVTGPDGNIYLGTLPHAHWVRYSPRTDTMTDLGIASSTEEYIWNITVGADHKIYGVTYPNAKLVQLDPATGKYTDLGRMDPTQQYARFIVASQDGFLYIGIGSQKSTVVAYNIATKQHTAILPYQGVDIAYVYMGNDNNIYAQLPDGSYELAGGVATKIPTTSLAPKKSTGILNDGSSVKVVRNQITINQPGGVSTSHTFNYTGKGVDLYRLGLGPDGKIYGSTVLPAYLVSLNVATTTQTAPQFTTISNLHYAEVYSFISDSTKLYMAGYGYKQSLATYDPSNSSSQGNNPVYNPGYTYSDWRPTAITQTNDNTIYLGATPGYGKLGGPLVQWNKTTNTTQEWPNIIPDQSIFSLTMANGQLVGGTSIYGGSGSTPTQSQAKLFVWDPTTNSKVYETVPVPNATYISNLITAPNGLVYGFANSTLFTFDPVSKQITLPGYSLPASSNVYNLGNNIAIGSDGNIWGLSTAGVYTINITTNQVTSFLSQSAVTAGFVLIQDKVNGDHIYFGSNDSIVTFQAGNPAK